MAIKFKKTKCIGLYDRMLKFHINNGTTKQLKLNIKNNDNDKILVDRALNLLREIKKHVNNDIILLHIDYQSILYNYFGSSEYGYIKNKLFENIKYNCTSKLNTKNYVNSLYADIVINCIKL